MKHTEGPWRQGDGSRVIEGKFEGEWIHLANVGGVRWRGGDSKNKRYQVEMEANCQLMLAAPTMLEALESVLDDISTVAVWSAEEPLVNSLSTCTRSMVHAAIVKAKGQEK